MQPKPYTQANADLWRASLSTCSKWASLPCARTLIARAKAERAYIMLSYNVTNPNPDTLPIVALRPEDKRLMSQSSAIYLDHETPTAWHGYPIANPMCPMIEYPKFAWSVLV